MKYLHLYSSKEEAVGTTALTPYVGSVDGATKVVYGTSEKYGDNVEIIASDDYFIIKKVESKEHLNIKFYCSIPSGETLSSYYSDLSFDKSDAIDTVVFDDENNIITVTYKDGELIDYNYLSLHSSNGVSSGGYVNSVLPNKIVISKEIGNLILTEKLYGVDSDSVTPSKIVLNGLPNSDSYMPVISVNHSGYFGVASTYRAYFYFDCEIPDNYPISTFFKFYEASDAKFNDTINFYTDSEYAKNELSKYSATHTIVNVYKLDGSSWD